MYSVPHFSSASNYVLCFHSALLPVETSPQGEKHRQTQAAEGQTAETTPTAGQENDNIAVKLSTGEPPFSKGNH